jgi:hypothetical protein
VHLKGAEEMTSKDRFPNHETICGQCGATIYKPFKDLTDDEILDMSDDYMANQFCLEFDADRLVAYVRAVMKRASEK